MIRSLLLVECLTLALLVIGIISGCPLLLDPSVIAIIVVTVSVLEATRRNVKKGKPINPGETQ